MNNKTPGYHRDFSRPLIFYENVFQMNKSSKVTVFFWVENCNFFQKLYILGGKDIIKKNYPLVRILQQISNFFLNWKFFVKDHFFFKKRYILVEKRRCEEALLFKAHSGAHLLSFGAKKNLKVGHPAICQNPEIGK